MKTKVEIGRMALLTEKVIGHTQQINPYENYGSCTPEIVVVLHTHTRKSFAT